MVTPLPPLPDAFGIDDGEYRPGGRSMIDILVDEHHEIATLCEQLAIDGEDRGQQVDVLVAVLARHMSAEQQYLYPTARTALPDGGHAADLELVEDAETAQLLQRLQATAPTLPEFGDLVDALTVRVRQHAQRASHELFPRLRAVCGEAELIRLGNRVLVAEEAAPTRPHPATPDTPPANKVVDPAIGLVDKLRDLLARRSTRPEDLQTQ